MTHGSRAVVDCSHASVMTIAKKKKTCDCQHNYVATQFKLVVKT